MAESEKFQYESLQDPDSIREFLKSIMEGIAAGKIVLSSNGDEIVLEPASLLRFEVKAKKRGDESRLSMKISWQNSDTKSDAADDPLRISTDT